MGTRPMPWHLSVLSHPLPPLPRIYYLKPKKLPPGFSYTYWLLSFVPEVFKGQLKFPKTPASSCDGPNSEIPIGSPHCLPNKFSFHSLAFIILYHVGPAHLSSHVSPAPGHELSPWAHWTLPALLTHTVLSRYRSQEVPLCSPGPPVWSVPSSSPGENPSPFVLEALLHFSSPCPSCLPFTSQFHTGDIHSINTHRFECPLCLSRTQRNIKAWSLTTRSSLL